MANWLSRAWQSIWTGGNPSWADISFQPRPPHLQPGMPNISIGAGPVVRNWPLEWSRTDEMKALSHPAFWRCVHIVAGAIGSMPIHAYRGLERLEPPSRLLAEPSPSRPRSHVWHQMAYSLLVHGNALAILSDPDRLGWPQRMRPIHPLRTYAYSVDGEIERYAYIPQNGADGQAEQHARELSPSEVLHIWGLTIPGEPFGIGILEAMQRSLQIADYLRDYAKSWFEGAGIPSGVLQLANPNPSQEIVDDAKKHWMEKHGGPGREPAVLPGDVEWKPVASTPEASQLLATRQWSNLEIALMFGVPPHMVQAQQSGQSMTYSNIETEAIDFVKFGLLYWLTQIEESMTTRLPGVQYCRFNLDALMRTDTLNRAKSYEIFANMGALTTTEIRGLEGRPPLEEIRQPPGVGRVQEPPQGAGLEVLGGGQGG